MRRGRHSVVSVSDPGGLGALSADSSWRKDHREGKTLRVKSFSPPSFLSHPPMHLSGPHLTHMRYG